ncbi:TonB-dependent copper receptor [Ferrimonas senticii]|uniref:TonB-dependent copper receptor n=1 Tax=Ferrimonas senticii TaxID=394566 RepID=UPI0004037B55|nr:TonB-dependent copper receptor [Ferrimonas senticii]
MKSIQPLSLAVAVHLALWAPMAFANADCGEQQCDDHIVVVAELADEALTVITDPKQPRQPIPTFDGSGYLKTIPGFTITRKGGSGGDISLRGMAGSRVAVINDGQHLAGTCGGRMDPPTNYIAPETYEQVTVIKGPQTVKYGPVGSAGTVLFERDRYGFDQQTVEGRASIMAGSFGRFDYVSELKVGDENHYWSLDLNGSESDHFEDGDGKQMQSKYDRENLNTAIGWTPTDDSVVELSYGKSSGSAEYADRANKARTIDNENWSLLAKTVLDHDIWRSVEFQGYWNENDHIMDQFDKPGNDALGANPRRTSFGGHLWGELELGNVLMTVGVDHLDTVQDMRNGASLDQLLAAPFKDVFGQTNTGIFVEAEHALGQATLFSGIRADFWDTELLGTWQNNQDQTERSDTLYSGFVRYQYEHNNSTWYAGVGRSERLADYWEASKSPQKLDLDTEKTNQLDIGWLYHGPVQLDVSLFYADIQDYILIKDVDPTPEISKLQASNIDATLFGGEVAAKYEFAEYWSLISSVAYTRGENDTANIPLGQISPLEGRLALNYDNGTWSFGGLWRLVDNQDRVAEGQGNIVGQDFGATAGFGVVSVNGAWSHSDQTRLSFGIDNLFDRAYAEHVSKAGAGNDLLEGNERTVRVNEPGRNFWVKLDYQF